MTDKEYNELKTRLLSEGLIVSSTKAVSKQTYFRRANDYCRERYDKDHIIGWHSMYDHARLCVMWAYEVTTIDGLIQLNVQEEANDMLISILKMAFDKRKERA